MGQDLAGKSPEHHTFVQRGYRTAEALLRKSEPQAAAYMDRVVPKTYEFVLMEPGGDELLTAYRAAVADESHVTVSMRKRHGVNERWVRLQLRPGGRLTLNDTINVIENNVDGRSWLRLSWVVQDSHEVTVSAVWQQLVPRRANVGRLKLCHLYADGKLMLPDTFIATQLQCRLPDHSGAEEVKKSLLWKDVPGGADLLARAIEQPNNHEKVLNYLEKLRKAGKLHEVKPERRPTCFSEVNASVAACEEGQGERSEASPRKRQKRHGPV